METTTSTQTSLRIPLWAVRIGLPIVILVTLWYFLYLLIRRPVETIAVYAGLIATGTVVQYVGYGGTPASLLYLLDQQAPRVHRYLNQEHDPNSTAKVVRFLVWISAAWFGYRSFRKSLSSIGTYK